MWALVFSFLSGWFARFIGSTVFRFIAYKVLGYILFVTILPVIIYNVFSFIIDEVLQLVSSYGSSLNPVMVQLTGLAAYLADNLNLPEAIALVISALLFRVTIKIVSFGRL